MFYAYSTSSLILGRTLKGVSNLVFFAHSTSSVILGRTPRGVGNLLFFAHSTSSLISERTLKGVSRLVFYAHSTSTVMSGRTLKGVSNLVFYAHSTSWVSRFGLAIRCKAGKQKCLGSIPLRLSFLFKKVVVCGHCLVTLSLTVNETLKWLSSLPILMYTFWS